MKTILHVLVAAFCVILITAVSPSALPASAHAPRSPIKHLIVIVGENHTFDNLFGAYRPAPGSDQTVMNLLSEEIINPDGSPGPRFASAAQWQARVQKQYSIAPDRSAPYAHLPQPNTTYAFGQKPNLPDVRFPVDLPNGPFQLSRYTAYQLSYTGDPSHRFFQMWQQYDEGRHDLFVWDAVTIGFSGWPSPSS